MISPGIYLWLLLKASFFSTGGMGNVPSLHYDLLLRGWAADQQFAEALAVGQVSPGPNGLWVISLGYLTYGVSGALLALVAITIPPLLVVPIERAYRRVGHHPAIEGFMDGLSLAVVGIFVVVLMRLLQGAGLGAFSVGVTVTAFLMGLSRRVPVILVLILAGLAGVLVH